MAASFNGVIVTATGDLKRAGYCDFSSDGSFDSATQTYMTGIVRPAYTLGDPNSSGQWHRWNGSAWVLVSS